MSDQGDRGERGPVGDSGEQGVAGVPGIQGIIGLTGVGERGRTGDHGQEGAVGPAGPPGRDSRDNRRRQTAIYVFVVAAMLIIGLVVTNIAITANENSRRIGDVLDTARYEGCLSGVATIRIFNAQLEKLADIDERVKKAAAPQLQPLIQERIDAYRAGILPVPDCDSLKP